MEGNMLTGEARDMNGSISWSDRAGAAALAAPSRGPVQSCLTRGTEVQITAWNFLRTISLLLYLKV